MKTPDWREIVRRSVPRARFARGASRKALDSAESALSVTIPLELRGLLSASNGVSAADDLRLVWPVAELVALNQTYRELAGSDEKFYASFDGLLFFGEDGNGDVYAHQLEPAAPAAQAIMRWDHETDERTPFAPDLEHYFKLRGDALSADLASGTSSDEDGSQIVSVWVWSDGSEKRFIEYLEPGGSGRITEDGLPQSRFHADYGLSLIDVLQLTQHSAFETRLTELRRLLEGIKGGEPLVDDIAGRAAASGRDKVNGAILLYGLRYELRVTREPGDVAFIGCFEFD